jgi:hypothetical protein
MGLKENLKVKAGEFREKATEFAGRHSGRIDQGLDKIGRAVDKATKHKYSQRVTEGTRKAKKVVDDMAARRGHPRGGGSPGHYGGV